MTRSDGPILCATDFSPSGERAVELAFAASRAFELPLVLAHVMDTGRTAEDHAPPVVAEADRVLRERVEARVDAARSALEHASRRSSDRTVRTALLDGRPWEALVAHAAAIDASLIVVGAHGASGPARIARGAALGWLLGSTADRVVRASPCPVLVVPAEGVPLADLEKARWLVGITLEEVSQHALDVALQLAARAGAQVEVVHVAQSLPLSADVAEARAGESALEGLVQSAAPQGGPRPTLSILHGDVAEAIVSSASKDGALVVVGTHARRGLARAILGSVAERVLRTTTTPVLVVPPPAGPIERAPSI